MSVELAVGDRVAGLLNRLPRQIREPERPEQQVPKYAANAQGQWPRKSPTRKMYKNKYGKPLKNFRVNPEKEEEPSIVEIKGIPTVREPRKRSSRKVTRY